VELTLQVQYHDQTPQLTCHGHLVAGKEAEALLAALGHLLSSDLTRVIVNLQHVRKMDCAGLGVLADAARRARQMGKSLELTAVPAHVRRLLQITQLDSAFGASGPQSQGASQVTAA
jgi:anti-anti-sigma factor